MATTAAQQIVKLVPTGKISFRNLRINKADLSFTMEYAYLEGKKRKFNYQEVKGHVTRELYDWFTKVFIRRSESTAFKLFLERKGIEFKPGILSEMEFVSENKSINFDDCPFRLTISESYGNATLNLVYKFPKVVKSERFDIETGKTEKVFGYKKYQNMKKEYFRRLEIYTTVEL